MDQRKWEMEVVFGMHVKGRADRIYQRIGFRVWEERGVGNGRIELPLIEMGKREGGSGLVGGGEIRNSVWGMLNLRCLSYKKALGYLTGV